MSFFNVYSPFVEAPKVRTTAHPSFDGIAIDMTTAQGVSFRNPLIKQTTLIPQINSGRTDFVVDCYNFGSRPSFDESTPYIDHEKWTAEKYIQDPEQFGFPLLVGDFLPNDGCIEPLTIRDVATRETIEDPVSHRIRGHVMDGNEDSYDGVDLKSSFISYKKNSDFVPFEDASDVEAGGLIVVEGFLANSLDDKIGPFDDRVSDPNERFIINNDEIVARWNALERSPFVGKEDFILFNPNFETLVDSVSGFVGTNNNTQYEPQFDSRYYDGTDSNSIIFNAPFDFSGSQQPISVSYWVRHESIENNQIIFSISGSGLGGEGEAVGAFALATNSDGSIAFYRAFSTSPLFGKTTPALQINEWNHIVFTYDGGKTQNSVQVYVNSYKKNFVAGSEGVGEEDPYGEWFIGNNHASLFALTGSVADLIIRTDILNLTQIEYLAARKPGAPDLTIVRNSRFFDDDFRPYDSKSSTSGFVYFNSEGTDSLAFGGLLR